MLKRPTIVSTIWIVVFVLCALPTVAEMIVDTAWVRGYNGPGNNHDEAHVMAVDGSGNVYVAGQSCWDSAMWVYEWATIKYDPSGNELWVQTYTGRAGGADDKVSALAVDGSGNVHVTGNSYGGHETQNDWATIKYDSSGNQLWVRRYDGPGKDEDYACDIAVDGRGNVYVTGFISIDDIMTDRFTIKYDADGNQLWARAYNGPADSYDGGYALALDSSGNVYVTGGSVGNGTGQDILTMKYDSSGNEVWVQRYNGPGSGNDAAHAIGLDGSGNVFVTGDSWDSTSSLDYVTIKYDSSGNVVWVRRYNGPGNDSDGARAMAIDVSGNVAVTGLSIGVTTGRDYATVKYGSNGTEFWHRRYNGPGNGTDLAQDMAMDLYGNLYVTGVSGGSGTLGDYATIKYDPWGNEVWVQRYNGCANWSDVARAVAVDHSSNVYLTGRSAQSDVWPYNYDYITIKYFQSFLSGDANCDGVIDVTDLVHLIWYLFTQGSAPEPWEAGDCNCDGVVDVADVMYLINYLFIGGSPPDCP